MKQVWKRRSPRHLPRRSDRQALVPPDLREAMHELALLIAPADARAGRAFGPNPWEAAQLWFGGGGSERRQLAAQSLAAGQGARLWRLVSHGLRGRYIGETEKNIERIFAKAGRHGWVLFFDEADALFGKRTAVEDSHDRYANQEVSYLLQRAQDYRGVVILSSNLPLPDARLRGLFAAVIEFGPDEDRGRATTG